MTKAIKFSIYGVIICAIALLVLKQVGSPEVTKVGNIILYVLLGLFICFMAFVFVLTVVDNKKIQKLHDSDKFDELEAYCKNKISSKIKLFDYRDQYYYYLILLCAFSKDNKEDIDKYYELLISKIMFPITYYWKACYDFANNDLDNVKDTLNEFINTPEVKKNALRFSNVLNVSNVLLLYLDEKYQEAKEKINDIDIEKISMPATKRSLDIVKNHIVDDNK